MDLQQKLTGLLDQRKALQDRLWRERRNYKTKALELGHNLDEYDLAATETMALLMVAVQHLGKSHGLHGCLETLEAMRYSHGKSHQSLEELCGMVGNLISLVVDMESEQFELLHEELQKQVVLSGTRDHVSDVRLFAFYDVVDRDPAKKQQHPSLSSFLDALQQEYVDFGNGRIRTRPLNSEFGEAMQRLGLSNREWQLLKTLSKDSAASFHKKFTIKELETQVFPSELEPCREALVKAARKVDERRKAMAVACSVPPADEDNWA